MTGITFLKQIGQDAALNPFPSDWKTYINNRIIKSYFDQPNIARMLNPYLDTLAFDGKSESEVALENDIDDAEVGMEAGIADTDIEGDVVNMKTPQIYITARMSDDKWAMLFAGQNRSQRLINRMSNKIKIKEDLYVFRGKTGIHTGLITQSTDLGNPTGNWSTATNGILTNFQADIKKIPAQLDAYGVPSEWPIDVALTSYAYSMISNSFTDYNPEISNRMIAEKMLRGGKFVQSDNLQASVTTAANTMLVSVRAPTGSEGWTLQASGFDIKQEPTLWGHRIGIRQKVAAKVLNAKLMYFMDAITVA